MLSPTNLGAITSYHCSASPFPSASFYLDFVQYPSFFFMSSDRKTLRGDRGKREGGERGEGRGVRGKRDETGG